MFALGLRARDKITGFEGVIVERVEHLFDYTQYRLALVAKDGTHHGSKYFDEERIEIIGPGISAASLIFFAADEMRKRQQGSTDVDAPGGKNGGKKHE